jgi:hypothetical protein
MSVALGEGQDWKYDNTARALLAPSFPLSFSGLSPLSLERIELLKLFWYDSEYAYTSRMLDLASYIASK